MKHLIFTILFIFYNLIYATNFNIDTNLFYQNYKIKYLGIEEGLSHLLVNCMGEHPDGYLFIATQEGISIYNGYKFEKLPDYKGKELLTRNIHKIYKDSKNVVWFIPRYNMPIYFKDNTFYQLTPKTQEFEHINEITEYNNKLFLATNKGLFTIQNNNIKKLNYDIFNKEILTIKTYNNYLYISTISELYVIQPYNENIKVIKSYTLPYLTDIIFQKNIIWATSFSNGIYKIENNEIQHLNKNNGLLSNFVNKMLLTSKNELWLATDYGINIIKNGKITTLTDQQGLSSNAIQYLYEDSGGNIWIATLGNKITLLKPSLFYTFKDKSAKINHNVFSILLHKNKLLSGTYGFGIEIFNTKGVLEKKLYFSNQDENTINSLIKVNDEIWASNNNGIVVLDNKLNIKKRIKIPNYHLIGSLYYSSYYDKIYLATYNNFIEYDYKTGNYKILHNNLSIFNIVGDRLGNIYITTENEGIYKFNNGKLVKLDLPKEYHSTSSIYIDANNDIWFCAENYGLVKYTKDNKYYIVSEKDGLHNNFFFAIEEFDNRFWISCNSGIFTVSKQELEDFFNKKITKINCVNYNHNNGIENSEFNGGYNFASAKDGNYLYFANVNGVVAFNPNKILKAPKVKLSLSHYLANYHLMFTKNKNIILPWNQTNRLEIKLLPIIFENFNTINIYYKLNNENEWNDLNSSQNIIYTNLKPGQYELYIKINIDGNKDVITEKYNITVEGIFYRNPWFISITSILSLIILLYFFDKYKNKRQLEKELKLQKLIEEKTAELKQEKDKALLAFKEAEKALMIAEEQRKIAEIERQKAIEANKMKSEIVRLVAHDLKNPLGAIQSFASYIFEDIDDSKEYVLEHAKHIKEAADSTLIFVSELLRMAHLESGMIKPNYTNTSIISLINNIISKNAQIAYEKAQEIIFKNELNDKNIFFIDPILTSEIITNYLSNAIKYSPKSSQIFIEAKIINNKLRISVIDNGPGFLEEEKDKVFQKFQKLSAKPTAGESSHGLGLSIVKLLAEVQEANIGFDSEYRKGSTFYVEFDLEKISPQEVEPQE